MYAVLAGLICTTSSANQDNSRYFHSNKRLYCASAC